MSDPKAAILSEGELARALELLERNAEHEESRRSIAALRGHLACLDDVLIKDAGKTSEINILTKENRALSSSLAEAREALEPFAREVGRWHESHPDKFPVSVVGIERDVLTLGDLRRAARAYEALSASKETK